jgi:hypothetical protein
VRARVRACWGTQYDVAFVPVVSRRIAQPVTTRGGQPEPEPEPGPEPGPGPGPGPGPEPEPEPEPELEQPLVASTATAALCFVVEVIVRQPDALHRACYFPERSTWITWQRKTTSTMRQTVRCGGVLLWPDPP